MLKSYREDIRRTLSSDTILTIPADLEHGAMGLASEVHELEQAMFNKDRTNVLEELGDMLFYVQCVAMSIGSPGARNHFHTKLLPYTTAMAESAHRELAVHEWQSKSINSLVAEVIGTLVDQVKRWRFYGKYDKDMLIVCIDTVMMIILDIARRFNSHIQEIIEINIAKRRVRYPNGFSAHDAVNRDLTQERSALEGN